MRPLGPSQTEPFSLSPSSCQFAVHVVRETRPTQVSGGFNHVEKARTAPAFHCILPADRRIGKVSTAIAIRLDQVCLNGFRAFAPMSGCITVSFQHQTLLTPDHVHSMRDVELAAISAIAGRCISVSFHRFTSSCTRILLVMFCPAF